MKITRVEVWRVSMQLIEPYSIAYETVDRAENIFVLLHTDGPHQGVGCAAPVEAVTGETVDDTERFLRDTGAGLLVGRDPTRIAALAAIVRRHARSRPSARAAVDMALHDLLSRIAGLPLYRLLGAYRTRIRTSVTIGIHGLDETVRRARARVDEGFSCLKIKGGLSAEEDSERVIAVRRAVGPRVSLRFDANQGYTVAQALAFLSAAAPADLELLEQPTLIAQPDALGEVSRNALIPVMADESVLSLRDAFFVARRELVDMINIKLMKTGGITEAMQINAVARSAGVPTMVGCMDEAAVGVSAGLHFSLSRPNIRYADLDGHLDLLDDPSAGCVLVRDGMLYPRERPGLGWLP